MVNTVEAALKLGAVSGDQILQTQVDELNAALGRLGKSLFGKGVVSVVELAESIQEEITASGANPITPIFADDYDPEIENEMDVLFRISIDDD